MQIQVVEHAGKVTMIFSERVDWVAFTPAQAREFAEEMLKGADYVEHRLQQKAATGEGK